MGDLIKALTGFLAVFYFVIGLAAGISWPLWMILWLVKG